MNFTIPKTTPSGKYLIRVEHMFHRGDVHMQVYVSGAHIEVFGAGGGTYVLVFSLVSTVENSPDRRFV